MSETRSLSQMLAAFALYGVTISSGIDADRKDETMEPDVFYRTVKVDGISIFYREAGAADVQPIQALTELLGLVQPIPFFPSTHHGIQ